MEKTFCLAAGSFRPCLLLSLIMCCIPAPIYAQNITGIVKDADSHITLPGAAVVILESQPLVGTVTDANGNFNLTAPKVGRYNLQVSYIGYETAVIYELLVQSAKIVVLEILLKESATEFEGVEVKANANKDQALNPMAIISSRQLSVEEASRYAGGVDDPARLAASYAGVAGSLSSNAIVIRGNAPKGLLWRMEGIEIPNPSHFANVSTFGGGGITALSSQMLSNSDFYTGAFPAEFGNALSGVFDMKVRTGNNEHCEHTLKAGLIGLDFATEGPFIKGKKSSYLVNYRYSTLALISPLLPENARGLVYQDLSFKMNFPAGKAGIFGIWGIFSSDKTGSDVQTDSSDWEYYQDIEKDRNINRMGAMGLSHRILLTEKTYLNTTLAATGNYLSWVRNRLGSDLNLYPKDDIAQNERKYSLSFLINHKFSGKHTMRSGFVLNRLAYNVSLKQDGLQFADEHGGSGLIQVYTQSRFNILQRITANLGLHAQLFTFNNDFSLEPRAGIQYRVDNNSSVSFAYGLHSRLEPIGFYFATKQVNENIIHINKELELSRAHHIVLAYDRSIGEHTRIKFEPFYQHLYNIPVKPGSSFSMMNLEIDWFFNDSLVNKGSGRNIGIDMTLERFLHSGYYYLVSGSVFDARYTGGDNIERNARFNKQYVFNFLFGKEWMVGKSGNNILGVNWKFSILGGDRIHPVDYERSLTARDVVYNETDAFAGRKPAVYYLDCSFSFQKNRDAYSSTWSFQFVNLLFQKEFYGHRYNLRTGNIDAHKEIVVIPNISYKINF